MTFNKENKKDNKKTKIKKKREEGVEIALSELKSMKPFLIIINSIVLLICGIYVLFFNREAMDWRILTGLAFGNAAILLNFYHLGVKASIILRSRNAAYAKRFARVNFTLRFVGALVVFGIVIHFELVNIFTALIPLFYLKIYYTLKALRNKHI